MRILTYVCGVCVASLAYLTAATHGLEEESAQLGAAVEAEKGRVPDVDPDARLLRPPVPISQQETNWPLLTTSRGFFEGVMAAKRKGGHAAAMVADVDVAAAEPAGWGDDGDLVLDEGQYLTMPYI